MTRRRPPDAALWAGVLAGPIGWASDLGISYAIVKRTCGNQHTIVLHIVTLAAVIVIAAGAFFAWRSLGQADRDRVRFMAALGLLSCAFFALVVVATAIPEWVLNACQ
jgi:hypothetical protein